ncbi:hypothetical protein [Marivita sp. GX14005]|uniref:hypothetical protein n=1 Tax=Marivita sp. GX14005 TaxID=2942276 RepID=UPI002018BA49|nr:hypothetical protein [Marivita sp. GX14005]MCL3882236.1 hypothetical protein [Marivita sp. GX14005]
MLEGSATRIPCERSQGRRNFFGHAGNDISGRLLSPQNRRQRRPTGESLSNQPAGLERIEMKRLMIATALATTLGTGAFALTEAEMIEVQTFNTDIDTSGYTEQDYNIAYGIIHSGMSHGEKTAKLKALEHDNNIDMGPVRLSEAEIARLREYAPDADLTNVTQAQAEAALAVSYGANSEAEAASRVASILQGKEMDDETTAAMNTGRINILRSYVPDADLAGLTEDELELALAYAHSGMSRGEKVERIQALLN